MALMSVTFRGIPYAKPLVGELRFKVSLDSSYWAYYILIIELIITHFSITIERWISWSFLKLELEKNEESQFSPNVHELITIG